MVYNALLDSPNSDLMLDNPEITLAILKGSTSTRRLYSGNDGYLEEQSSDMARGMVAMLKTPNLEVVYNNFDAFRQLSGGWHMDNTAMADAKSPKAQVAYDNIEAVQEIAGSFRGNLALEAKRKLMKGTNAELLIENSEAVSQILGNLRDVREYSVTRSLDVLLEADPEKVQMLIDNSRAVGDFLKDTEWHKMSSKLESIMSNENAQEILDRRLGFLERKDSVTSRLPENHSFSDKQVNALANARGNNAEFIINRVEQIRSMAEQLDKSISFDGLVPALAKGEKTEQVLLASNAVVEAINSAETKSPIAGASIRIRGTVTTIGTEEENQLPSQHELLNNYLSGELRVPTTGKNTSAEMGKGRGLELGK